MKYFLITLACIAILFAIYLIVAYCISSILHKKTFNQRQELDKRITFFSNDEFSVDRYPYSIDVKEGKICGHMYYKGEYDKNKLIVFCHGMGSSKEAYIQEACYIASKGYLVYLFDYLGTNESSGDSLKGFKNSIKSLDYVIQGLKNDDKYKDLDLYVCGHSWGGYACSSILKLHPDIKGAILLSPMISVFKTVYSMPPKKPYFFTKMFTLYDALQFNRRYWINILKAIDNYKGKLIIIQSKDDPIVPYSSSLEYLEKNTKNKNITFVTLNGKMHNPDYTIESVNYFNDFNNKLRVTKDPDRLYKETDFKKCGELDTPVWDNLLSLLFK